MVIAWEDYKHLFGTFTTENAEFLANLPQQLDREFELRFHVSNVGLIALKVPPRRRNERSVSDGRVLSALACFVSPSHMVQMEGEQDGWFFSAMPFRTGLPQVKLHTDRAYTLHSCVLEGQEQSLSAIFEEVARKAA